MTQDHRSHRQPTRSARHVARALAGLVVVGMLSSLEHTSAVHAGPLTFSFSGVVQNNHLKKLFPGKSFGDSYRGMFTVDPDATALFTGPDAAVYDGSLFDLTIEGVSHSVSEFRVWRTSPPGGGVEFLFDAGGDSGFLSLRSTSSLYDSTDVPTSFEVSDFDDLARAQLHHFCDTPINLTDTGSIDAISPDGVSPLTFNFSGIVGNNELDALFPGKSVGDSYSGSFTVDPAATAIHTSPDATFYDGSFFDLTIEGISHSVREFRVWKSAPPGGGVEFLFDAGGDSAFLSLRSTSGLYDSTEVPTSFNIADFDDFARTQQSILCGMLTDLGSIDVISPIPEPATIALATLSLLGIVCRRQRWM